MREISYLETFVKAFSLNVEINMNTIYFCHYCAFSKFRLSNKEVSPNVDYLLYLAQLYNKITDAENSPFGRIMLGK